MEMLDDLAGDQAIQGRPAGGGVPDRLDHLRPGAAAAFEKVTDGPPRARTLKMASASS